MESLWVVFLTGLTTGGLSCLAVQGGLLASSIARQVEDEVQDELTNDELLKEHREASRGSAYLTALHGLDAQELTPKQYQKAVHRLKQRYPIREPNLPLTEPLRTTLHPARPILLFLGSKLVVYTLFGLLLGWLGSVLQLTPYMRAALQIAIGIFMLGTALRMLNVHPIFRSFVVEPPKAVTRFIRRFAKAGNKGDVTTPIFLGALTVLIPCGVTQAMMILAIGTGNPLLGAATMFAFTLGTMPIFFGLAYVATKLGERLQARFLQVAAFAILILAVISIDGGLNLAGSPISIAAVKEAIVNREPAQIAAKTAPGSQSTATIQGQPNASTTLSVQVGNTGYSPRSQVAKADAPLQLSLVSDGVYGCTRSFVIPSLGVQEVLLATGTTTIEIPPQPGGTTLRYTCSMGMYRGEIRFS